MIYPSADTLENWGSKYSLVVLAAKRAKQIKSGAPPLVATTSRNPLTIALEEIAAGKIQCQVADHDILPKSTQEAEVAQLLAIPTVSLDEEVGEETEAMALFSDDTELLAEEEDEVAEEEEEDEEAEPLDIIIKHAEEEILPKPGFDEEPEEEEEEEGEHLEEVDQDIEPEVVVVEPEAVAPEAPKPKTRAAKKKEPDVVVVEPVAVAPEAPKPKTRAAKKKEPETPAPQEAVGSGETSED